MSIQDVADIIIQAKEEGRREGYAEAIEKAAKLLDERAQQLMNAGGVHVREGVSVGEAAFLVRALAPASTTEGQGKQKMVYLNGSKTSFRCECGANVFTEAGGSKLKCNGCDAVYDGQ